MLPVRNTGHHDSFGRPVAAELISNNDARLPSGGPQQPAKKSDRGKTIALRLHEDVEDNAVLIDSSPKVMSDAVDLEEHFIQMPFVAGLSPPSSEPVGILFAELLAPAPDRFV